MSCCRLAPAGSLSLWSSSSGGQPHGLIVVVFSTVFVAILSSRDNCCCWQSFHRHIVWAHGATSRIIWPSGHFPNHRPCRACVPAACACSLGLSFWCIREQHCCWRLFQHVLFAVSYSFFSVRTPPLHIWNCRRFVRLQPRKLTPCNLTNGRPSSGVPSRPRPPSACPPPSWARLVP